MRLCPQAVFLKPEFPRYRSESRLVFAIFREFTDIVQPVSIDEAYLDVSDRLGPWGSATAVAQEIRRRVREEIRGIPGLVDISDNYDHALPELTVVPDVEKAGRYGLRTFDIAGTIRTALHGSETAKYRVGEDEYEIIVRYQQPFRTKIEDLENSTVFYEGENIPLSAFATARFKSGLAAVHRIDAQRVVTVSSDVATGFNSAALLGEVQQLLARELPLPPGCLNTLWGNRQRYHDAYLSRFDGYYLTGDAGYKDSDGYLWIMSRTDDVINVAGHRLFDAERYGTGQAWVNFTVARLHVSLDDVPEARSAAGSRFRIAESKSFALKSNCARYRRASSPKGVPPNCPIYSESSARICSEGAPDAEVMRISSSRTAARSAILLR